jgi:nucleoside-diphosphate-sugar epimerase
VITAAKIGQELGWKSQIPLAEGLKRTVEYFRSR